MKRRWVLGAALVLVFFGFAAWHYAGDRPGRDPEPSGRAASTGPESAARRTPSPIAALPPVGAPLGGALPALRSAADAGNREAACRLAAELQACGRLGAMVQDHGAWLASRKRGLEVVSLTATPELVEEFSTQFDAELDSRQRRLDRLQRHCEGVTPPDAGEVFANWRRAALLGDAVAIRHYTAGSVFRWGNIVETAPFLPTYKGEAEALALSLAQKGDLEMTIVLAAAYSPISSASKPLLSQVVTPDPAMSLALYRRAQDALAQVDAHEPRNLATAIGLQAELVEQVASDEVLRKAQARSVELDAAWKPVVPVARKYPNAYGELSQPTVAHCVAQRG